ncbi:hypothetical protein [Fuerstiella marisgermanici]|uniref:PPi-type phosphoenolpyruvate carboxykinase lobe 2 domain-containing protein n=1 Tax=Fuerstiella marisgermanici TaxID=1891926 RepID=A0A1P8WEA2_9PLAN|nr:hypothetical protein [Fuerstiella marisgermanici]APZ92347.1 hypothetical protein Fuma_01957 [Fuerstiella marisgermanici]
MAITNFEEDLGFYSQRSGSERNSQRKAIVDYIALKLIAHGQPAPAGFRSANSLGAERILNTYQQRIRQLDSIRCPVDQRIESFLADHFKGLPGADELRLPDASLVLDRHGIARELSLPLDGDHYSNSLVSSYRVHNGVLHNPRHDRRTTKGTFHVAEGGLPIPDDKIAVPQQVFVNLFRAAMKPPKESMELPFTADQEQKAYSFVSLLLRPLLCPEVPGYCEEQSIEVRFVAPGSLVSNLDFVESIFGNGGNPFLPENDAALDVLHWSGHTGCVILAPHLTDYTKKELGLPSYDDATERQRRDGACWQSEDEPYNNGTPFKITCRTEEGVIVTLIADNYFGYCKKEVKTQLSYAANLSGNFEEEHAGGALAYASYNLGDDFIADSRRYNNRTFADVARDYADRIDVRPEGYGIDKQFPELVYVPEDCTANVHDQNVSWYQGEHKQTIPLTPGNVYMTPSGFKVKLEKHPAAPSWRLIGTASEGVCCHKPCTVSGGGKSEISKSIADYLLHGPIFVADVEKDLDLVQEIFDRDYSDRWSPDSKHLPDYTVKKTRKALDPSRSLGSLIKLLTPSSDYTDEYNAWLESIPGYVYAIVFIIKRMHRGDETGDWRKDFTVDIVNGHPGHELKYGDRTLVGTYLRVGLLSENTWRTYKLRQDFAPAQKVQTEDDISASVVVPTNQLDYLADHAGDATSVKFAENCEYRLFQRPDDAIHRGLDKQTEADLARDDNFIVNFEPLSREQIRDICDRAVDLSQFTDPMQKLLLEARDDDGGYVVCSATPRIINGKPSKNPRYLQMRLDLLEPLNRHVAEMGVRLFRAVPSNKPVRQPVNSVLVGRRNNPADYENGIRPLAVYNPIHYQELPELFMDFISSLTGKSPSTTGAGSEGALTKGPFNALLPITDLNAALVSYLLTDLAGFSTSAGHIGANVRVDHDISLLIPEIWCRLSPEERSPKFLLEEDLLEKMEDFEWEGKLVMASRLGYRVTSRFIRRFAGRVFDNPRKVFDDAIMRPETQDPASFADGILYITEAHQRVARNYLNDGSIDLACPPLRALLHIMAEGNYKGKDVHDPEIRKLFTLQSMLDSDWYEERLKARRQRDQKLWQRHVQYLQNFQSAPESSRDLERLNIAKRLETANAQLKRVSSSDYLHELHGTLGADRLR